MGGPLTKRRTQETGSIPDATLRAMDVAGNLVRTKQGRAPTTDPRIGKKKVKGGASVKSRKSLIFGGVPGEAGSLSPKGTLG